MSAAPRSTCAISITCPNSTGLRIEHFCQNAHAGSLDLGGTTAARRDPGEPLV